MNPAAEPMPPVEHRTAGGTFGQGPLIPTGSNKRAALAHEVVGKTREAEGLAEIERQAEQGDKEVWAAVRKMASDNPRHAAELAKEVVESGGKRAVNAEEGGLLLHRMISVRNELAQAQNEMRDAGKLIGMSDKQIGRLNERVAELSAERDLIDRASHLAGSEGGRTQRFRRMMVKYDYSLDSLMRQAEAAAAAAKRPLSEQERTTIAEMANRISALEDALRVSEANLAGAGTGHAGPEYPELVKADARNKQAKQDVQEVIDKIKDESKPAGQRVLDLLQKLRVAEVISSPLTLAKIGAASIERVAIAPLEEAVGSVWRQIPGIAKIAALAPREGGGFKGSTEAKSLYEGFTQGMIDAYQHMTNKGRSELDIRFGDKRTDTYRPWLDWIFNLHAAAKDAAVRSEYTRSFLNRIDAEAAKGGDVTSPAALERIGIEAYKDSNRAKFQQDNAVVDAVNKMLANMKRPDQSIGVQALGRGIDLLLPVKRIPTNIVAEIFQYAFGTVTGGTRAAVALAKGVETLKPAEADHIMRSLKKGSLGAAVLALGYLAPNVVGGFYSGRRDDSDVKAGAIRIGGANVPSWLLHNPMLEVLQMGASIRRAQNSVVKGEHPGLVEAIGAGISGAAEQAPMIREATEIARAIDPRQRGWFFGNLSKSFAVPQFMQWLAGVADRDAAGETVRRRPQSIWEHVQTGIPGLRQRIGAAPR